MPGPEEAIGNFLLESEGCQWEDCFHGWVTNTTIYHKRHGETKTPYVIGVRYERSDASTPSYGFHFHIIERSHRRGDNPGSGGAIEKIESFRQFAKHAVLAADTIEYYVACPDFKPDDELREWAIERGVGILSVAPGEQGEIVRTVLAAETIDMGIKRSEFVANASQRAPGNFRKAIESTSVLRSMMAPRDFFDDKIRPFL